MRVSVVVTVLNEAETVDALLSSLAEQTRKPDEVIVVDGGSVDGTVRHLEAWVGQGLPLRYEALPGCNISEGRNAAIERATGELIAVTDGGVRLHPDWLRHLVQPFEAESGRVDVVAGFFQPDAHSTFQAALGATTLPSVQDVDPGSFLPSSRSVAFTRRAWEEVGGYPEWLDYCEDVVFDLALREKGYRFRWAPDAIVYFRPRPTLLAFFRQYYRYARGDGKADLWRRRHAIRYASYIVAVAVALLARRHPVLLAPALAAGLEYTWRPGQRLWVMTQGWNLGQRAQAAMLIPVVRLVGDVAKMAGYPAGVWWRWCCLAGPVTRFLSRGSAPTFPGHYLD